MRNIKGDILELATSLYGIVKEILMFQISLYLLVQNKNVEDEVTNYLDIPCWKLV